MNPVLLIAMWRKPLPVALVLAPLLLSSVVIVGVMAVFDIPFNFANVVVIPLLLGIGVDSGIHLVHRAEVTHGTDDDLMDTFEKTDKDVRAERALGKGRRSSGGTGDAKKE